jgi:hypothetical protein
MAPFVDTSETSNPRLTLEQLRVDTRVRRRAEAFVDARIAYDRDKDDSKRDDAVWAVRESLLSLLTLLSASRKPAHLDRALEVVIEDAYERIRSEEG